MNSYNGFTPAQRFKALRWLRAQEAAGLRIRPTVCEACGQTEGMIDSHSEDYSEPYGDHIGAYRFCYVCHMMIHCRRHNPERWDRYRQIVRDGFRMVAPAGRNWGAVKAILSGSEPLWQDWPGDPRERTVLDDIAEGIIRRRHAAEDGEAG